MAKRPPYSIFTRIACVLLALHFFNFSIDPTDRHPDSVPEDLSINDIESVSELVVEVVLSCGNVFAEHDEQDSDGGSSVGIAKLFLCSTGFLIESQAPVNLSRQFSVTTGERVCSRVPSVISPPPKA